ncbi:TonB-dependent receptor [Mucilaginibacter terrenus]|uniref:TonB-dependent receptor n=1 Tax=Mucilaginibacter terrenus TaxID=2482727 RepID=A0A3E2NJ99_9SPHI|nr:TonB-dependent receptor [Mucilaginibacter terrenus]RFZ81055.1 TonB-dependent receptor [Mucilaginibacter terrenus]
MKITISTLLLFFLFSAAAFAQKSYSVKGAAIDSASNAKLLNASVSVLNAKDSILRKFTRAGTGGAFSISGLNKGNYILMVTYPDYADYVEKFTLDSAHTDHNFGSINMQLKSRLLKEVLIKGTVSAIKIKGDTTEYNAAAFKIEPNSKVEDLIRQLPGMQVDKDGKITAQGQAVPKVLVDGEEFFGDDPTLVTKNLRADMVDKVQLYDKKSDQATFTGIDDGEKTKTINIKLKEDKKNGYFGKVNGGVGTDGFYESQALFNRFKGKEKFSGYATAANTGKTGLGWEDNNKLGNSDGLQFGDNGEIFIFGGGGDDLDSFDGRYNGQGLPKAYTGGLHYDKKFDADKQSINTNYKAGSLEVDGTNNSQTQNDLPGRSLKTNADGTDNNYMFRQKLDAMYQVKIDSTSNLKVTVDGTLKNSRTRSSNLSESMQNDTLLNRQDRSLRNYTDAQLFNATAFYNKKLKKTGRTFSVNFTVGTSDSKSKGNLNATTDYFKAGLLDSSRVIDQYKTNDMMSTKVLTNVTYTEPFSKYFSVVLNYGLNINNSEADRKSFDQTSPGVYNSLVDSLSSDYKFNQLANQGGAIFNYKKGKQTINFGTKVSAVRFKQVDQVTGDDFKRSFTNWNPTATYQYRFSQQKSFSLRYNGSPTQPTFDQIQPIRNNNDPLNITIGNPDLGPSFTHRFNINFNSYKTLTGQYLSGYGSYSFTTDPIVNNITTDTSGKNTIQYLNLPNRKQANYYGGFYFDRKIAALDFNVGLSANLNGNTYYSLKNGAENKTTSNTISGRLNFNKYVQKKFSFDIGAGPTYTRGQSSLNPNRNNNGRGFNANGRFNVYLPGKIQVGADGEYQYQAATQSFDTPFEQTIINANITKTFFKAENLKLILSGNDLLNQNSGFSRNASGLYISQSRYTTIRRYFMLSVQWDFNKMGGGAPAKK